MNLRDLIQKKLKPSLSSYSDLYAPVDRATFSNNYGKLCSVFSFGGLSNQPLRDEYKQRLHYLANELAPFFMDKSHDIHVLYEIETSPDYLYNKIHRMYGPNFESMQSTGLNFKDLYEAKCHLMKKLCLDVRSYFAIWTTAVNETKGRRISIYPESASREPSTYSDSLLIKHNSAMQSMQSAFNNAGFVVEKKGVYKAITFIRESFNSDLTPDNYKPSILVGDSMFVDAEDGVDPIEGVLPPLLNKTVTPGRIIRNSFNTHTVGTKKFSSFDIERFPARKLGFDDLINKIARIKRPVRISMRMSGNGSKNTQMILKDYIKFLDMGNSIKYSIDAMKNLAEVGGCVVGLQSTISTWVNLASKSINESNMDSELNQNIKDLIYAVNGWGSTEVDDKGYDPIVSYTNTIPGFKYKNTAKVSAPPIHDAISLMPFWKMHNLWDESIDSLFHTNIGQMISYKRHSAEQANNILLVSGKPGCGKSVLLNDFNLSLACHPGLRSLPFISVVDIKPSSFGALQMIKDALPESKKHLVVMNRIRNREESAINPNDIFYGARHPTNDQFSFILNFWSLATQSADQNTQDDEVKDFLSDLIREVFKSLDDGGFSNAPKLYKPRTDAKVDGWLKESGYHFQQGDTWWKLFDYFHDKQLYVKAAYVQRYTSPTLKDMINMCNRDNMTHGKSLDVVKKARSKLESLSKRYPVLNTYSRLDYSSAKIISLDLQPVAGNSTWDDAHQTAIFYMLAQEVVTRNFSFTKDDLLNSVIDEKYYNYHNSRLEELKDTPKAVCYDELHMLKMSGTPKEKQPVFSSIALNTIVSNIRVKSRAEKIEFILVSQDPEDFTGGLKDLYTSAIVMGCSKEQSKMVCETYGLDKGMAEVLPTLGNPGPGGSSFVMVNQTKHGMFSYVLWNPIPPEQIWGTSTTKIDVFIRTELYKLMNNNEEARKALALCFPSGSAEKYAENMASNQNSSMKDDYRAVGEIITERILSGEMLAGRR